MVSNRIIGSESYIVKVEGVNEIGHVSSAPRYHLICLNILVAPSCEPLFNKKNLRVMVCSLRKNAISASPWGDHVERYTEA